MTALGSARPSCLLYICRVLLFYAQDGISVSSSVYTLCMHHDKLHTYVTVVVFVLIQISSKLKADLFLVILKYSFSFYFLRVCLVIHLVKNNICSLAFQKSKIMLRNIKFCRSTRTVMVVIIQRTWLGIFFMPPPLWGVGHIDLHLWSVHCHAGLCHV